MSDALARSWRPPASGERRAARSLDQRVVREPVIVAAVWLILAVCVLGVFSVPNLPASLSSWDVLHSGRQFAERGFLASRLQPRWMPINDPAPYITYTHYPPLTFWISGVVQSLVAEPQRRIHAMMRLTRLVAVTALLCGYVLLRQFGIGPAAAALAIAMLVWSQQWWVWTSGELSWCSWWGLYQFAAASAFTWGLHRTRRAWRAALLIGTGCCAAAALSAFDAWLWAPTFFAVLFCLMPRRAATLRRRLLVGLVLACAATGVGVGGRVAVNWWHFGSLQAVIRDLHEAFQTRSAFVRPEQYSRENAVNYLEVPQKPRESTRWEWIAAFYRRLPASLARAFLPAQPYGGWIAGGALALALPAWWAAARRRRARLSPTLQEWPNPARGLIALSAAPMAFVLACPAINVQQPWGLLGFAPAVLLVGGLVFGAALATLARAISYLRRGVVAGAAGAVDAVHTAAAGGPLVTALAALVTLVSVFVRLPAAPGYDWPLPLAECRAAMQAVAGVDGVVFVNVTDANPLMYLVPIDSAVAIKPFFALKSFLKETRPVRILLAESLKSLLRRPVLDAGRTEQPAGLPPGWLLIALRDRHDVWPEDS